jgi:hypothetical protein
VAENIRKYHSFILLVIPLFIMVSTSQHAIDLQNFFPADHPAASAPALPAAEVLEEISSEDDIHSILVVNSQPQFFLPDTGYLIKDVNFLNQIVPTPPPDRA